MEISIYFTSSWHSFFHCQYLNCIVKSADSRETDLKKKKSVHKTISQGLLWKEICKN